MRSDAARAVDLLSSFAADSLASGKKPLKSVETARSLALYGLEQLGSGTPDIGEINVAGEVFERAVATLNRVTKKLPSA